MKKNVILVYGGGSTEHEVSELTAQYIASQINQDKYHLVQIEISKTFDWLHQGENLQLDFQGNLVFPSGQKLKVDVVIPCIHGYPGETGDLQAYLEMINVPYLGANAESSRICFNKILTKLWLDKVGVPTTPFVAISELSSDSIQVANNFFEQHHNIFIKASNQGSSVGCFPVNKLEDVASKLTKSFEYSDFVLIEKTLRARELEVSVFEYNGNIHITEPGEIVCPDSFYSYEQKYDQKSQSHTLVKAPNITVDQCSKIKTFAEKSFKTLGLKDLSRVDFFLTNEGEIYLNEINTFPGMTPISMFPKMMEAYGISFKDYLDERLSQLD